MSTLSHLIRAVLDRMGLQRQTLAQRLRTSPSAVTRLLSKPDDEQIIGQLKAVAEALDMVWSHSLYSPAEQHDQLRAAAHAVATVPYGFFPAPRTFQRTLAEAAEHQMQRAMRELHDPQHLQLPLSSERGGGTLDVVGWFLGQVALGEEGHATLTDTYWVLYTSHGNWRNPDGYTCNVLYYEASGYAQMDWINPVERRIPLRLPTAAGRSYLRLRPTTTATHLGPDVTLVSEQAPGGNAVAALILSSTGLHADVPANLTAALATLPEVIERGSRVPVPVSSRIEQIQRTAGVPLGWREHDLFECGFATQAGLSDAENAQAIEDASQDSVRRFARQYRVRPEWVLRGDGPVTYSSTLKSLGWYGHEILDELARQVRDLQAVFVVLVGDEMQFAWQLRHPSVPGISVYDYVTPLSWDLSDQRMYIKAVLLFLQRAELPVIGVRLPAGLHDKVSSGELSYGEYLRHQTAAAVDIWALATQFHGFDEVETNSYRNDLPLAYFYDDFRGDQALERLRRNRSDTGDD
ncbi:hypothetical protein K7W42_12925 [Deinococcus sp. HMF7604]|uniref:hypothetical protein n=1 Tax=Deinococcus betulae TaxID=2873312 RepID=UPI001CCABD29|nr:hypothetical protein [Deinococcus betulae]MBZ9751760.1 hypothetical protein [Deinococcus betulae]